ncbi:MAG TPA: glycosyltransferase [Gammaproteobacteria bacterium]|nr:glycosyltransferase [Gammaproteobacteria bacterium]
MLEILVVVEKNSWFDWHISASFEEMGHQVHSFYFGESLCEFYGKKRYDERIKKNQQLVDIANHLFRENRLDLIFCFVQDDFLLPEYAYLLEKLDVPFVNYCVDMACQWYRLTRTAKFFSYILCAQPTNINNMKRYAKKTLYFPMAARKIKHNVLDNIIPKAPVTFIGTPTQYRIKILSLLNDSSVPLAIYGKYWKEKNIASPVRNIEKTVHDIWHYGIVRLHGEGISSLFDAFKRRFTNDNILKNTYVPDHIIQDFLPSNAIPSILKQSKINLGFTRIIGDNLDRKGTYQMRLRDFEVPLTGGFYLVEKAPGYEDFFMPDKEIVTWGTPQDLNDKVFYYLKHEKEREDIAKEGQKRALKEHTWEHRFNMLFQELGIQY